MKKKFVFVCLAAMALCMLAGCKEKRCRCTTRRAGQLPAVSLEALGSHKSCSELDREWMASDSTGDILSKNCVEED